MTNFIKKSGEKPRKKFGKYGKNKNDAQAYKYGAQAGVFTGVGANRL